MNIQSIKQRFGIVGNSPGLDNALKTAIQVAPTELNVLIFGESGVGKEVFSHIMHQLGPRKHNNFIAINCGAIPEGTINSELFGHEKGAFTGASSERKGYFETVDGGTIFLDEIGEMPLDTQAFLLRVLESGEYIKVGSSKVKKTNVRVIAATNVDLQDKINKGKFREDLFYRLTTVPIRVPSLKERKEDIHLLFRKFSSDFAEKYRASSISLSPEAVYILEHYPWPGNIRELKNAAEQVSVLATERLITKEELLRILPKLIHRNLPAKHGFQEESAEQFKEREILYKLLFDMKNDLGALKGLVRQLIDENNLSLSDRGSYNQLSSFTIDENPNAASFEAMEEQRHKISIVPNNEFPIKNQGLVFENNSEINDHEVTEENLSLEDMEKEFIQKALKKHKGRRKDAASELGISERTLYRKIKQYEIIE